MPIRRERCELRHGHATAWDVHVPAQSLQTLKGVSVSVKHTPAAVVFFRAWVCRRAEKKALSKTMDALSQSRDGELNEVRASRDYAMHPLRSRPTLLRWFSP